MAEEQSVNISGEDIQAVSDKLQEFSKSLPPNQQLVIDWLLERAAAAPEEDPEEAEVSGYLFSGATSALGGAPLAGSPALGGAPFARSFNRALGFGNVAAVTATFRVGVRF